MSHNGQREGPLLPRADPTTGAEPLMPSDKLPGSTKSPRRAAGRRPNLADLTDLLKQQADFYDRFSKLPDRNRKIPKAEAQRILELLKAVPGPDPASDMTWFSSWLEPVFERSATASFISSMGSSLDIMPLSTAGDDTWWRDRTVLKDDTARIARDAWCVITRHVHDRRRRKAE